MNYSDRIELFVITIDEKDPAQALQSIINIDSDYEEVSEEIVKKIMSKNNTVKGAVKNVLELSSHKDVESPFILNNGTYCRGYSYELTDIGNGKYVLSLAYQI